MGEAARVRHAVGLSAEDLRLDERHECGVDGEGRLHGQLRGHDRGDDQDALQDELVLRLLALLETLLQYVAGGGEGKDEQQQE